MILSTNYKQFKKSLKTKNQVIYTELKCHNYSKIVNLFNFILAEKNSFIFESVEKGTIRSRYTIIGLNPDKIWNFHKNKVIETGAKNKIYTKVNTLNFINRLIKNFSFKTPKNIPNLCSMLVGYFSYDVIRYIEKIPDKNKDNLNIPDIRVFRPNNLIIYDDLKKKVFFIENIFKDQSVHDAFQHYENIKNKFKIYNFYLNFNLPKIFTHQKNTNKVKSNITKKEFIKIVLKAKEYIKKGDIFQVVLSQRFERKINKYPLEIYNNLRVRNPSPFMFYFNFEDFKIIGSSPEILVRLRNNKVTIRPIAGTRPRGKNKLQDLKLEKELLKDQKELAEHLMLLDLGRNDVGKISKSNSVKVTEKFIIERYSHVMHIVSNVEGKFNKKVSNFEAMLSGFPAGTVSGAPKIRAMEIIDELEKNKRKLYAGSIGYFSANGDFDTCIALRTALIKNKKIYVQAGAGIVADSNPGKEYLETINKAKALLSVTD